MKNVISLALFGVAVIAAVPANATTTDFNFTSTSSTTVSGVTVSTYAFEATGTTSPTTNLYGPTSTGNNAPSLAVYSGAGEGVCEGSTQNGNSQDCNSPNHQVDNGPNNTTGTAAACSSSNDCDFEFVLFQFSTAVDLSQLQLGNFGSTGSASDPFLSTYWTSTSTASLASIETALEATTVGGVAGTDSFSAETAGTCTTGVAALGAGSNGSSSGNYDDNCAVNENGVVNVSGTGVTYLLLGASVSSANAGQDFFKIQDLSISGTQTTGQATPEPATFALFGFGLAGLGLVMRKRKSV